MRSYLTFLTIAWLAAVFITADTFPELSILNLVAQIARAGDPVTQQPEQEGRDLEEIRFDTLTAADGLTRSLVNDILQDQYGFMWFATDYGLNRFNGEQFKVFLPDPDQESSLRHERITTLYEDEQGNLWIGTDEGLDRYDPASESFIHYPSGRVAISAITKDPDGRIWLATNEGLKRFDPGENRVKTYLHDSADQGTIGSTFVLDVLADSEGRLWVGTVAGLDRWDSDTDSFQHIPLVEEQDLTDNQAAVIQLFEDPSGYIWLNTVQPGLSRLNPADGSLEHFPPTLAGNGATSALVETSAYQDQLGRSWIGTDAGLLALDPAGNTVAHLVHNPDDPLSLADNTILSVFVDRSGLLWVGTAGGLSKENPAVDRFPMIQESNEAAAGLSDNLVAAVHQDGQGDVWIGTILGGLNRLDPETGLITKYFHDPADPATISSDEIDAIYEDTRGRLWIGTGAGLDLYNPDSDSFTHYQLRGSQAVNAITQTESDLMIIGTKQGLFSFDEEREFFSTIQGYRLYGNAIDDILIDSADRLWVATRENGLWMATPSLHRMIYTNMIHFEHDHQDPTSLGPGAVLSIAEDGQGEIWVGTSAGGLNHFHADSQTFTRYTSENGFRGAAVTCIVVDQDGQLWLGSNIGFSRFDPSTESFRNYGLADGLLGAEFVTCHQGDDGTMYFGGLKGLNIFDPDKIQDNQYRPPIVITGVEVNEEQRMGHLLGGEHLELPYDQNFIKLEFSVLDFANPSSNQIAYKMEGLDQNWIDSNGQLSAFYPDLQPGEYTFRVIGANSDGVWNEEGATLSISVYPPFWETWWFRGLLLAIIIAAAVAWYQNRARNLAARSRELEDLVAIRTAEVEERTREVAILEERQRLARDLHDSVTQSIYSLTLLAGATVRELTAGRLDKVKEYQQRQSQIAQNTLKEMRLLVYQLRPSAIAADGLITAIQQRLDAVEIRSGIDATFIIEGELDLPPDMELQIFNIVQEALNNALKHAEPASVSVRLAQLDQHLTLVIHDDGCGFDLEDALKFGGMGLESMHERAEQMDGTLTIESEPDVGTTVHLEARIKEPAPEEADTGQDQK